MFPCRAKKADAKQQMYTYGRTTQNNNCYNKTHNVYSINFFETECLPLSVNHLGLKDISEKRNSFKKKKKTFKGGK